MSAPESELVRLVKPRSLPAGLMAIEASEAECAALAKRFGVTAIHALKAVVSFGEKDGAVLADGTLTASIEQPCAVSRDDFTYDVTEPLSLRFVPEGSGRAYEPDEEIELDSDDLDEIEYASETFDIGEAVAQTLGLALDPYREGPSAEAVRQDVGIEIDEDRAPSGPLADALKGLRL